MDVRKRQKEEIESTTIKGCVDIQNNKILIIGTNKHTFNRSLW